MNKKTIGIIGAGAAAAALTLGAVTMATAADDNTNQSPTASSSQPAVPGQGQHGMGPGAGETPLTGEEAEKVTPSQADIRPLDPAVTFGAEAVKVAVAEALGERPGEGLGIDTGTTADRVWARRR